MTDETKEEHKDYNLCLVSEDRVLQLDSDWQGCVHIRNWSNGYSFDNTNPEEQDYIHICNLPEFIKQLQYLQEQRKLKIKNYEGD